MKSQLDDPFGSVESVKTVSELYAPISGKVVEVNEDLNDSPESVNESPYDKAWMIVDRTFKHFRSRQIIDCG